MKKAALFLVALATAAVSAQVLTPEQTLDRRAIGERGGVAFSPDGSRVVFSVAEPVKGAARARAIWLYELASGRTRPLTFSGKNDSSPQWSPDGASIAFLSDRDGPAQIYRLSMRGGDAEKLTDRKDAIRAFRWSPDGRRIALLMPEPKPDAQTQREKDKDDSRTVDRDTRHPRVWMLDVASHALTQVTRNNWRIGDLEWLPDGTRLVAVASEAPASDSWNERLYTIDAASGRFTPIADPRRPVGEIAVSPDGRTIAYVGARVDGPEPHDLYLQPIDGGAPQNLTASAVDRPIGQPKWIDNDSLAVSIARGFTSEIATVSRDGRVRPMERLNVNPSIFAISASGVVAYVGETATRAPELWVRPPGGGARAVTDLNAKWQSTPIAAPEYVEVQQLRRRRDRSVAAEAAGALLGHAAVRGPRARRADRPLVRHVRAVGSVARGARLRRALPERPRIGRLRPEVRRAEPGRLGRRRLQGRDGRRRLGRRARPGGSEPSRHRRLVVRRLHGGVGRDADHALQGGGLGRSGHRHGERVRHRKRIGVRRVVLRHAVRKARGLHQELPDDVRQEREDADTAAPGRRRRDRSDRAEPAVLSRAEALRRRRGSRALSARAARAARGEAPRRSPDAHPRLVRQVLGTAAGATAQRP